MNYMIAFQKMQFHYPLIEQITPKITIITLPKGGVHSFKKMNKFIGKMIAILLSFNDKTWLINPTIWINQIYINDTNLPNCKFSELSIGIIDFNIINPRHDHSLKYRILLIMKTENRPKPVKNRKTDRNRYRQKTRRFLKKVGRFFRSPVRFG